MRFIETSIPGIIVVEPDVHRDGRGYFLETFHAAKYSAAGIPGMFLQDNHSSSVRNTLRGLHMQVRTPQGKLVRVIEGEIWDVAVDVRPESKTFGQWVGETLSAENFRQLYIPPGCAHGFCVLSEIADCMYACSEYYAPEHEHAIAWNDPEIGVRWPISDPILSDKDARAPHLRDARVLPSRTA